jgi:hypothetical protein
MAVGEVADVTISDMPMEEIISAIFQQGAVGSGSQTG